MGRFHRRTWKQTHGFTETKGRGSAGGYTAREGIKRWGREGIRIGAEVNITISLLRIGLLPQLAAGSYTPLFICCYSCYYYY